MKRALIVLVFVAGSVFFATAIVAARPSDLQKGGGATHAVAKPPKPPKPPKAHTPKPQKVHQPPSSRLAKDTIKIDRERAKVADKIADIRARETRQIAHEQEKASKDPVKTQRRIADIRARADRQITHEQEKLDEKIAKIREKEIREARHSAQIAR